MSSSDLHEIVFELQEIVTPLLRNGDDFERSRVAWREAVKEVQERRVRRMAIGTALLENELERERKAARPRRGPAPQTATAAEREQILKLRRWRYGYQTIAERMGPGIGWRLVQRICEDNGI